MIETTGFALAALAYSVAISSGSMATAAYFDQIHSLELGHALDLVLWCGGGIGLLAYAKQKLGKPAFNTACSLACMVIFVNLVRDGIITCCESDFRECPDRTVQRGIYLQNAKDCVNGSLNFERHLLPTLAPIRN